MSLQSVPRLLEWSGELTELTFSHWQVLQQCIAKALGNGLTLSAPLPSPLPNRATLVGRFHHELMQLVATVVNEAELEMRIEEAITALQQEVTRWSHLTRAGAVSGWREINASASLALRMFALRRPSHNGTEARVEYLLRSRDGLLVGRPDYFSIVDGHVNLKEYKTGSIRDEKGEIKRSYVDQLTFYAGLIFDQYKVRSVVGILESLSGDRHESAVTQEQASDLRGRVLHDVAKARERCQSAKSLADLASPSQEACDGCVLRSICPPFKDRQDELALTGDTFVAEGAVTALSARSASAVRTITLADEIRRATLTLALPSTAASEISVGRRYQALDLRRRGGLLEWSPSSRVLRYD